MQLVNEQIYFFISYLFLQQVGMLFKKSYFSKFIIILSNMIAGIYFIKTSTSASFSLTECFTCFLILGNTIVLLRKNFRDGTRLTLLNLQLLLAIYLFSLDNFLLHVVALIIFNRSFSRSENDEGAMIHDHFLYLVLFSLALLIYAWCGSFDFHTIQVNIKNNSVLIAYFSFLTIYPSLRLFSQSKVSTSLKRGSVNDKLWLWLGVMSGYFLNYAYKLNLSLLLESNLINLLITIVFLFCVLLVIQIENSRENIRKLILILLFNQGLSFLGLVLKVSFFESLYSINLLLVLLFLLVKKYGGKNRESNLEAYLDIFSRFFIVAFLIGIPLTPWFSLKFFLIQQFIADKSYMAFSLMVILLGLRFRQDLMYIPGFIRLKSSNKSKPS